MNSLLLYVSKHSHLDYMSHGTISTAAPPGSFSFTSHLYPLSFIQQLQLEKIGSISTIT